MKRKIFNVLFALVLVLGMSLVTAAPAAAATINVPATYATIQEAITAATAGDTIIVAAGAYDENVVIDKALTLQGASANITPTTGHAIVIQASNVTVDGFNILPQDNTAGSAMGIAIDTADGTSGVTISHNTIVTQGNNHGIWVDGSSGGVGPSSDLTISTNDITVGGYSDAVYAGHSNPPHTGWVISGNTFSAPAGDNIDLYDVNDVTIDDNVFETSLDTSALITSELSNLTGPIAFTNNDIQGNGNGSMVAFVSDFFTDDDTTMDNVIITGNTFDGWAVAARALRIGAGVTNVTVNHNEFLGSGDGLKNQSGAEIDAQFNYWGSANGPTHDGNTFNVGYQGASIVEESGAVDYVPWYDTDKTGASFSPVKNPARFYQFSSIGAATDNATPGDTITCAAGTYTENVYIDQSLTLQGAGADVTAIDGNSNDVIYITLDSENVTVNGFSVIDGMFGIHLGGIVNGSSVNINHNIIAENYLAGIRGSYTGVDASSVTIEDNEITANSMSGITFWEVTGESTLNIFRNTIYGNGEDGVKVTHLTDNSALNIIDNYIYDNSDTGVYIYEVSTDSTVVVNYNSIAGNGEFGVFYNGEDATIDATCNWWGDVAGPTVATNPYFVWTDGDAVTEGNVTYLPWLIQSELAEGWNIWSMPIAGDPDSLLQMQNELVEAGIEAIYYFDSATQLWGLDPDAAGPLDAFYIKMTDDSRIRYYFSSEATMPSQKAMKVGWNFIGLAELYPRFLVPALSDAYWGTGVAAGLPGYNKVMCPSLNGDFWTYLRGGPGGLLLYPTKGYWVLMVNDGILGGFTSTPIVEVTD